MGDNAMDHNQDGENERRGDKGPPGSLLDSDLSRRPLRYENWGSGPYERRSAIL